MDVQVTLKTSLQADVQGKVDNTVQLMTPQKAKNTEKDSFEVKK